MPIDLPPQMQERVVCSVVAAMKYEIPANIVLAVAEKENGKPGQWVRNENGTHDVGSLQFNTAYLVELARYGITPANVAAAGCYPYELAAWRLRQHITKDQGDLWTRSANYHSRTPRFNEVYRADLMKRAARWADWLADRFPTHELSAAGMTLSTSVTGTVPPVVQKPAKLGRLKSVSYLPRKLP
jgi:hypothetical protein